MFAVVGTFPFYILFSEADIFLPKFAHVGGNIFNRLLF